jgi:hypothetical protein
MPERAKTDKSEAPIKTRLERLKAAARDELFEPDMPPTELAGYLIGHLWAAGPATGEAVISSGELRDYQHNMGVALSPWECQTLRRLSGEYLGESFRATKPDCECPWVDGGAAKVIASTDARDALRALEKL